jgi:hypothetical protein
MKGELSLEGAQVASMRDTNDSMYKKLATIPRPSPPASAKDFQGMPGFFSLTAAGESKTYYFACASHERDTWVGFIMDGRGGSAKMKYVSEISSSRVDLPENCYQLIASGKFTADKLSNRERTFRIK